MYLIYVYHIYVWCVCLYSLAYSKHYIYAGYYYDVTFKHLLKYSMLKYVKMKLKIVKMKYLLKWHLMWNPYVESKLKEPENKWKRLC